MHRVRLIATAGITLALAAGCAGSHTQSGSLLPQAAPAVAQPAFAQPAGVAPSAVAYGTAEFVIAIDREAQNPVKHVPAYISSNTQSMKIQVTYPHKNTYKVPLTSSSKGCTQAKTVLTCTVDVSAAEGDANFVVILYGSKNATGAPLSEGLASGNIRRNRKTKIRLRLDAIAASMVASVPAFSMPNDLQQHTLDFTVGLRDATGASIVGGAILKSDVSVDADGFGWSIAPRGFQKIPKSDVIVVRATHYAAQSLTSTAIRFQTTNVGRRTTTLLSVPVEALQVLPSALPGLVIGASAAETAGVSETGFGGAFKIQNSNPAVVTVSCAPATCAPATTGGTVDLTFTAIQIGTAAISISDALGSTYVYSYSAVGMTTYTAPVAPGRIDNMIAGPDGNLWGVVESGGSGEIAQIAPSSGTPTYYPLPAPFDPTHSPVAVAGPDGAIWLIDEHTPYLYRVSTAAGTVGQVTTVASADGADPTAIILGSNKQTLFYTDSHGNVDSYNVVTKASAFSINPFDNGTTATISLTQDPKTGWIYFTDSKSLYKLANGAVTDIGDSLYSPPQILHMGPDGNLWYTQSGQVVSEGIVQPFLCKVTLNEPIDDYTNPSCTLNSLSWSINTFEFGPDGAAWIVGVDGSQNVQMLRSTTSNLQTYFLGITCCPVSNGIATGPDGALWIATTGGVHRVALTQAEAAARSGGSRSAAASPRVTPRPKL